MKNPNLKLLAVAALSLGSIGATQAAVVYEKTMSILAVPSVGAATNVTHWDMMIGEYGTIQDAVFSFYLPTLASGESFSTFNFSTAGLWDQGGSMNLYAVGTVADPLTTAASYYVGSNATESGNILLQAGIIASPTPQGRVTSVNLASYINSLYTAGTPSNTYVQFRLNMAATGGAQKIGTSSVLNGFNYIDGAGNATTGVFTPTDVNNLNGMTQLVTYEVGPKTSFVWDGANGGDWNDAVNWNDDTKPVAGDTAVFSTALSTVNNAVGDQSILNIVFDLAAGTGLGTFSIGSVTGNSLILGNGGSTAILSSLAGTSKIISIDAPVTLTPASETSDGTYSLINNSTDSTNGLKFTGTIQASTTSGTETLVLSGSNTGSSNVLYGTLANGAASALAVHKKGAGTWNIDSHTNPHNNSYTGGTKLSGGTLQVNAVVNEHTLGAGSLTFDGGTLLTTGSGPELDNDIVVNNVPGNAVITTEDFHCGGNITGSGTLTHHLDSYASLGLYGNNSGFTGTYVQDANGSNGWTYFYNTAAGSPNASWVVNNRGLAGNMGTATIHLGSLAGRNTSAEIGNHGGGSLTFVLGENNAPTSYDGLILNVSGPDATEGGTTAIVKEGSDTLIITNVSNNYSGGTQINGGTLGTDHSLGWGATFGTGPITLNGGTLLADTSWYLPNHIIVNPVAGNKINLGQGSSTFTGNLTGSGDVFVFESSGAWTALTGTNSGYSGTITVDTSIYGNFSFGPSATSDAAAWVLNCSGVVGANTGGSQTLNFGSLSGTNSMTRIGDGYNSSTLVKIGARNTDADYAGKIVNAWYKGGTTRVTKVGKGVQTLSGALSYKGNTTIVDGVLSITSPNFDDASTVTIGLEADSPAVLDLPNAGTDTVASLVIDGVAQDTGKVYGNSSSVLPVVATSAITGPGRIQVVTIAATDYDTWAVTTYGLQNPWLGVDPALNGEPSADPDNDGLINQQEYAFGLIPDNGSSVNPIITQLDKTAGTFTYQRRASTGLTYRILTSPDLISWPEDVTATQSPGAVDGNGNRTVAVTLTGDKPLTESKMFVRVAAE